MMKFFSDLFVVVVKKAIIDYKLDTLNFWYDQLDLRNYKVF